MSEAIQAVWCIRCGHIMVVGALTRCVLLHFLFELKENPHRCCDNIPTGRSPLSQPPKPAHSHPIVKGLLSSPARSISHLLYKHTRHNIQPRGWKKRRTNKHGFGLGLSARREKFVTLLYGFLWAIASVYPSEIPTQPPGTLTLALAGLASESTGPNSSVSSHLSLTVVFPRLLLTAFFC